MTKVLFTGGRHGRASFHTLDLLKDQYMISEVVHGGARGVDTDVGEWARLRGIPVTVFIAEWARYGDIAGRIRNQRMLNESKPDLVIAFPGGTGTEDMKRRARDKGVTVYEV